MIKNRYAGRTFIQPSQSMRQRGVNVKLSPLREEVRGRRLVVVDDSIVRGTTTKQIVSLLRRAGAAEVHLRISAPPIFHPCFYGIDTQIETELIASRLDLEEIRAFLGADSLSYLSIGGVLDAIDLPRDRFCFACFDGRYPVPVPYDVASHKFVLEDEPLGVRADPGGRDSQGREARSAYAEAGVDVVAGDRAVALIRDDLGRRRRGGSPALTDLLGGLGGFAAAVPVPAGMREPVLVCATDGVGTKTEIARQLGRRDTIGRDLVAMCADDVACHGARPYLFLDYIAAGRVEPGAIAELVRGVAAGCEEAGCSLVGGETAEHPGLMAADAFDLAGFCVGVAERADLLDGQTAETGDAVIGIASSGLHANGYSLVRALVDRHRLDLGMDFRALVDRTLGSAAAARLEAGEPGAATASLGEVLLTPTRIYARDILELRAALRGHGLRLSGLAHVTGGGLPGNLPRAVGIGSRDPGEPRRLAPAASLRRHGRAWRPVRRRDAGDLQRRHRDGGRDRTGCRGRGPGLVGGAGPDRLADRRGRGGGGPPAGALRGGRALTGGRIAVAVSGQGSNLRALVAAERRGGLGGRVVLVVADRDCPALEFAEEQGIATAVLKPAEHPDRAAWDAALTLAVAAAQPDLLVLAGFMRVLGPATLGRFEGRILNVHPALLPAFPGRDAIREALDAGVRVTGVTVHLVDETLDGGPIVAQEAVPVLPGDDLGRPGAPCARRGAPSPAAVRRAGPGRGPAGRRPPRPGGPGGRRRRRDASPGPAVRLRQDRHRGAGTGPGGARLPAGLDRRHGPHAARRRAGDRRRLGCDRLSGDARRSREDPAPAHLRRPAGRPPPRRPPRPARRGRDRTVRAGGLQPLSLRGGDRDARRHRRRRHRADRHRRADHGAGGRQEPRQRGHRDRPCRLPGGAGRAALRRTALRRDTPRARGARLRPDGRLRRPDRRRAAAPLPSGRSGCAPDRRRCVARNPGPAP